MPIGASEDPLGAFNFFVEVQPWLSGAFRECSGLGSETETAEYKASGPGGQFVIQKVPGNMKWSNINLKRGISSSMDAWKWRKEVEEGKVDSARSNGSIIMYNQTGAEVARWNFTRGWPSKISGPSMNANGTEIGIEELEIVHEGLIRDH